ncbi:MAG TPA: hypothetical protein VN730_07100 [Steroidobacteraceae bacterium]|nr:hypothetical protein [Steroidobacteraceae bacterium]
MERFTATLWSADYASFMAAKYYTHFVTATSPPAQRARHPGSEWSGVVELKIPLVEGRMGTRELRTLLAQSFDVASEDIRILHWARLH